MAIVDDIARSWTGPGTMVRRLLPRATEARVLSFLMGAAVLMLLAQAPGLARAAADDPSRPFAAQMLGHALGFLAAFPALAYGLAALSHVVARAVGGAGTWLGARLALFWSLLAAAPLILLHGLVLGLIGPGPQAQAAGLACLAALVVHWMFALVAVERPGAARSGG